MFIERVFIPIKSLGFCSGFFVAANAPLLSFTINTLSLEDEQLFQTNKTQNVNLKTLMMT